MKNPVTVLRTTTAILISLSLAGTETLAAGASSPELAQAAQVLPEQAQGQAKGKEKDKAKKEEKAGKPAKGGAAAGDAKSRTGVSDGKASQKVDATAEGKAEKQPSAAKREAAGAASNTPTAEKAKNTPATKSAGQSETAPAAGRHPAETTAATEKQATQPGTAEKTAEQPTAKSATSPAQPTNEAQTTAPTTKTATTEQPATKGKANGKSAETTTTAENPTATTAGKTGSKTKPGATTAAEKAGAGQKTAGPAEQPQAATAGTKAQGEAKATTEAQAPSSEGSTAARTGQQAGAQAPAAETIPGDQVTAQEVDQATEKGEDVVIKDKTTTKELQAQLKQLRQQQADLQQRLQQAERVGVQKETVTKATAPRATEERADDDDNQALKYLGSALAGAAVGALVPALGGRLVDRSGDRVVVERNGEFFVRSGEDELLRQPGARVQTEQFTSGVTRTTVTRDDGSQVVTIRNPGGFILRRTKITPAGEEIVLLEQTPDQVYSFDQWDDLQPPTAHRAEVIDYGDADRDQLQQVLVPQPVYQGDQSFPLIAVLDNQTIRELVPAIDLPINFATGSAAIRQSEIDELEELGQMIGNVIDENPRAIFLVAGHTDGVGSNVTNLVLSDKRAETVALALTEYFDIPPENLVVQGYGERFLKVPTEGPSEANRRVAVRNITPLLREQVASR